MALLDDFNRVADPLGSQWSAFPRPGAGRLAANGSQAYPADAGQTHGDYWNVRDYGADVEIEVTVAALPANVSERLELFLRVNAEDDAANSTGYRLRISYNGTNFDWTIYKMAPAGGLLALSLGGSTVAAGLAAGDLVKFEAVGTTLTAYRFTGGSWTSIVTGTDFDYTLYGRIAIAVNGDNWRFDDFKGTDAGPPPVPPTFVGAGTKVETQTTATPQPHANTLIGDKLLLLVETSNELVATPSGWTQIPNSPQGAPGAGATTATRLTIFEKVATVNGAAGGPLLADPGNHFTATILSFHHSNGTPVVNATAGDNSGVATGTGISAIGPTTTVDECLVLIAVAKGTDSSAALWSAWANTNLIELAEVYDAGTTLGDGGNLGAAVGRRPVAGATGTTTATGGGTNAARAWLTVAVAPPASSPPAETDNFFAFI